MKAFAQLLERLAFTNGRNAKMALLAHYLRQTPDPDRGWALAALTDGLALRHISRSLLRTMIAERFDPQLFEISYHFVGDLAETIALLWPDPATPTDMSLSQAVTILTRAGRTGREIAEVLDQLPKDERLAFLKLGTGNLRLGLSGKMARAVLAEMGGKQTSEIEEIWHGLAAPYVDLFHWIEGGSPPQISMMAAFRPVMLSTPVTVEELGKFDPQSYLAEWKWDGIRVQAVSEHGEKRLYARSGDDISHSFPDILSRLQFDGVVDGELLIARDGEIAPFADLQKRLGRKTVSRKMMESHPAHLRLYDILFHDGEDLRGLPLYQRRAQLEVLARDLPDLDLSPNLAFTTWEDLADLRANPPSKVIEGVMIKDRASPYIGGRPRGPWFKWKRDPMLLDAVLLYAQAGHGKRSGFYSDFTFGLWLGESLVPVGKAYFGFTDAELRELDRFVRKHTAERFGPVRRLHPELVVEVAFEGVNRSERHKSGVAMRFPRISRIRWDKPAAEADHLSALEALL